MEGSDGPALVLCADDEQDILDVVTLSLRMLSEIAVETCTNGAEAVSRARECLPDIILLDVMMPVMDGVDALQAIRRDPLLADTPVVLMTARVQPSEVKTYLSLGATGVITKPFDPMTLADDLRRIWRERRMDGPG